MTTPTTPAMTAQEALGGLRSIATRAKREGWANGIAATVIRREHDTLAAALSDAERRATEAEGEREGWSKTVRDADEDMQTLARANNDLQARLSAVEARCGLMREALQEIVKHGPNGGNLNANVTITLPLRALYDGKTALAYPGGKSDQGEKEKPADIDDVIGRSFAAATKVEPWPLSRSGDSALVEAAALLQDAVPWLSTLPENDAWRARRDKFIQQHGERK